MVITDTNTPADYRAFLASKRLSAPATGFSVAPDELPAALFDWQKRIVVWSLARGRGALFAECGLGKTPMQLAWAQAVCRHTDGSVLVLAPLAVAQQTAREGQKFGVPVTVCSSQAEVTPGGVNITNYERLAKFDTSAFAGVVLDESSILKNFMGATKRALVAAFAATPYRLCCTATPAPNDHMELGNHAEFLGVMPANEMLMRWFINDTMLMGHYRLKGHAERDYWAWVASWALALRRPADVGASATEDARFTLPALHLRQEIVAVDRTLERGERLFRDPTMSATTLHHEMRLTAPARAERVAALVDIATTHDADATWAIWCNTDYEADELRRRLPGALEVRGSHPLARKEAALRAFAAGESRILISKPSVCGYGLNWQHCAQTAFVGLSYSFEDLYQALRRLWRFGQTRAVEAFLISAETEGPVLAAVERKIAAHERMVAAMVAATREATRDWRQGGSESATADLQLASYAPALPMQLPSWLQPARREAGEAVSA